ncbi:MAG: 16S rRNA (guanine(527)-N(7))-methyltransferase RsmG [Bacteroidia bacterium]|nr:16S rRNA (guanine(527)-N(7))-methyltransferase RsmG [Bacteroidia bacterium]MDW8089179.1 16S rRNA (guanine(527)-N(7))-methyltransferase RsmG [Bacteroidia bacterium]
MASSAPLSFSLPPALAARLSLAQLTLLARYEQLLKEWNRRLNLISRRDIEQVGPHHILPSLLLGAWWSPPMEGEVLDLGTGGGLPGIPLAILFSDTAFRLIDSTRKKVEAVTAMVAQLGLAPRVRVQWVRAEALEARFPVILGRAVAPLPRFLKWAEKLLRQGGVVFYYTGEPLPPLPAGWVGEFYPFRTLVPESPYLATKGILRLQRRRSTSE